MSRKVGSIVLCAFMLASVFAIEVIMDVDAQITEEWGRTYNGPGNYNDFAFAMAVDQSGNVYVTGESLGNGPGFDIATIKYDTFGNEVWVARYNGPVNNSDGSFDIAVDPFGDIYITGYSAGVGGSQDYITIKYDTNGNIIWEARYDCPANQDDRAMALALDSSQNVYVTGISSDGVAMADIATVKYDSYGNEVWATRYNSPQDGCDRPYSIAVDTIGNTYVTGETSEAGTGFDYLTIKYGSTGNEEWVKRYNGPGSDADRATDIRIGPSGNIYITGSSMGSGITYNYTTIAYDTFGNEVWVAIYNGPGNNNDFAWDLVIDSNENIYVTGGSAGIGSSSDFTTIKYGSSGNEIWVARYNSPGNMAEEAWAITLDSQENVFVTGRGWDSQSSWDYITVAYDNSGKELWAARYNGLGNGPDWGRDIVVDSQNNVYVTGWIAGSGTEFDYATIKYSEGSPNQQIIADAGPDQKVNEGEVVKFKGSLNGTDTNEWIINFQQAVKVNQGSDGVLQWYPAVAANDTGCAHVAWEKRYNEIYTSRSSDGLIFTNETVVSNPGAPEIAWVTTYADNIVHVIWGDANSQNKGIWMATSNDSGVTFQNPVRVRDEGVNKSVYEPFVTVDKDGVVYAAWFDTRNNKWDVYFAKSNDGGATFSKNVKVNDDSREFPQTHANNCPKIAIDDNGTIYIVWKDNRNGDWDIYFSKSTDGGKNFTANFKVNDDFSGQTQSNPTLTIGRGGTLHIAWSDRRAGTHIYYANSTDWGATFSSNKMISDGVGALWEARPSLAMDGNRDILYLVWNYRHPGGNDGDILFSKSKDNCNSFSPSIVIDNSSGKLKRWYPVMTIDRLGNIHIVWQDGRNVHEGLTDWDIYYIKGNVNDIPLSEFSFTWDFNNYIDSDDDGNFTNDIDASGSKPSHIYCDDGVYTVTLTVTNNQNLLDTDTCVITVTNLAPTIDPFGPFVVDQGESLFFDATAIDPGSDDLSFTWDWGDGTSNTMAIYFNDGIGMDPYPSPWGNFPFSAIDTVQHIYQEDGVYTINLTLEDDDGGITVYSTSITVNMVTISPPIPYLKTSQDRRDVILYWDPPEIPGIDYYLIYRSTSQTEFDFNSIWVNTSFDKEPGELDPIPLRTIWNDTNAAHPENITNYKEQFYYIIRAVNTHGEISRTSRTVGKWTKTFSEGISSLSLPLEPFDLLYVDNLTTDMEAEYIKYMDYSTHNWIQHDLDKGATDNNEMRMGEGYEVKFQIETTYTFCGMPGAMISYNDASFGFDAAPERGDAQNLTVSANGEGNVTIIWAIPEDTHENVTYRVYRSERRDGFWGTLDFDYEEIYLTDVTTPGAWIIVSDPGIALPGTEHYYMVVPIDNIIGERGVSSYSVGVWVEEYLSEYDTMGTPLKIGEDHTADWFCDNIPKTIGINYYCKGYGMWLWHTTRMPKGAFDPILEMTKGYQISTSNATEFTYIGI